MNPWLIIAALTASLVAVAGAGYGGFQLGVDHEKANQIDRKEVVAAAVKAATETSAQAIAAIKPKFTTIKSEVQREILTNTVFADCKLPADSLRLVNQALSGGRGPQPVGDGKLPADKPAE